MYTQQVEIDRKSVITKMRYNPNNKEYSAITLIHHEVDGKTMNATIERCFAKGKFDKEVDKGTFKEFLNRIQTEIQNVL